MNEIKSIPIEMSTRILYFNIQEQSQKLLFPKIFIKNITYCTCKYKLFFSIRNFEITINRIEDEANV